MSVNNKVVNLSATFHTVPVYTLQMSIVSCLFLAKKIISAIQFFIEMHFYKKNIQGKNARHCAIKMVGILCIQVIEYFFYNQTLFSQNHYQSTLEKLFKVLETQVPIKHLKRACLLFSKAQDNFLGWALSLLILFDSYTDSSRYVDTQQNLWSIGFSQNKNWPSCANELLHLKWN